MHLKFDLKGSTVDRSASDKEKVLQHNRFDLTYQSWSLLCQAKVDPTLKDNDFIQMDGMISIGEEAKKAFTVKLEADVEVLLLYVVYTIYCHLFSLPPPLPPSLS